MPHYTHLGRSHSKYILNTLTTATLTLPTSSSPLSFPVRLPQFSHSPNPITSDSTLPLPPQSQWFISLTLKGRVQSCHGLKVPPDCFVFRSSKSVLLSLALNHYSRTWSHILRSHCTGTPCIVVPGFYHSFGVYQMTGCRHNIKKKKEVKPAHGPVGLDRCACVRVCVCVRACVCMCALWLTRMKVCLVYIHMFFFTLHYMSYVIWLVFKFYSELGRPPPFPIFFGVENGAIDEEDWTKRRDVQEQEDHNACNICNFPVSFLSGAWVLTFLCSMPDTARLNTRAQQPYPFLLPPPAN